MCVFSFTYNKNGNLMFTLSYEVRSLSISQYFYIDYDKGVDCAFNGFPFLPTVQKFTYHAVDVTCGFLISRPKVQ